MNPMNNQMGTISLLQFVLFTVQTQIGVGVLSIPYSVFVGGAHKDAWLSILISGCMIQLLIFLYWLLSDRFKNLMYYEIVTETFGKKLGGFIKLLYVLYFIIVGAMLLILFSYIVETWAYPRTPKFVLLFIFACIACYIAIDNVRNISRFFVIVSVFLLTIIIFSIPSFPHLDFRYIMPIGDSGFFNIILGGKDAIISLLGFEVILFLFPFVEGNKKQKIVAASIANGIVTLYYTYITIISLTFFSPGELKLVPQPVLYLVNSFSFGIIERVDIIFLTIWVISVMTTYVSYLFFGSLGLSTTTSLFTHKRSILIIAITSVTIALIPKNILMIEQWSKLVGYLGLVFTIAIPLFVFFITTITSSKKGLRL